MKIKKILRKIKKILQSPKKSNKKKNKCHVNFHIMNGKVHIAKSLYKENNFDKNKNKNKQQLIKMTSEQIHIDMTDEIKKEELLLKLILMIPNTREYFATLNVLQTYYGCTSEDVVNKLNSTPQLARKQIIYRRTNSLEQIINLKI